MGYGIMNVWPRWVIDFVSRIEREREKKMLMDMHPSVMEAASFAVIRHDHQAPRGPKKRPYVTHCFDVARRLLEVGVSQKYIILAAILHDTLEDTRTEKSEIVDRWGRPVADIVEDLTLPPECREDRNKKQEFQVSQMHTMRWESVLVKIADKTSNVRDMVENPPPWRHDSIIGYANAALLVVMASEVNPNIKSMGGVITVKGYDRLVETFHMVHRQTIDFYEAKNGR